MTAPLLYPERVETVVKDTPRPARYLVAVPDLAMTEATARLERGFFATVAAVCDSLSDPHALEHMTRGDLRRLVRLGELAKETLEEKEKEQP